jgi:hypothetical protein
METNFYKEIGIKVLVIPEGDPEYKAQDLFF